MVFLLLRYFCLLLRFFIFFNKTRISFNNIKEHKGIVLNDFSYLNRKRDEDYNKIMTESKIKIDFSDMNN